MKNRKLNDNNTKIEKEASINYKKIQKRELTPEEMKEKEEMEKFIDDCLNDRL